jgi:putative hemolysin
VDGKLSIDDASELEGVALPPGDYDTVAGLIYDRLGVIPQPGARVETETAILTVEELSGRRVTRVRLTPKAALPSPDPRPPAQEQ